MDKTPFKIRKTLLQITGVTEKELKDKYYLSKLNGEYYKNFKYKLEKSKKIRLTSQILNYLLIKRCNLTSHKAAELSFRKHPTPLHSVKVIEADLSYPSLRREEILKIINEFDKRDEFVNTLAES